MQVGDLVAVTTPIDEEGALLSPLWLSPVTLSGHGLEHARLKVRIVVNPADDHEFARRVEALAEAVDSPEELEERLRTEYPLARAVRGVTNVVERWYAYRDGRWTRS